MTYSWHPLAILETLFPLTPTCCELCFNVKNDTCDTYPFFASGVRREVIHGHFDAFAFLQLSQDIDQQLKVKGVGVVEIVLVVGCQLLIFFDQYLVFKKKKENKRLEVT